MGPRLLVVSLVVMSACASPLQRLADRAERVPAYQMGWVPPTTSRMEDLKYRLRYAAARINVEIVMGGTEENAFGTYYHEERKLAIREDLALDAQVEVVAHELAHSLQPNTLDSREREIFADAVSYLVTRDVRDDLDLYARYLAFYKPVVRQVLRVYGPEITAVAAFLKGQDGGKAPPFGIRRNP